MYKFGWLKIFPLESGQLVVISVMNLKKGQRKSNFLWPFHYRILRKYRAIFPDKLGYLKGQLQTLLGIKPGVAVGHVVFGQVLVEDLTAAAGAFGDIIAGHLEMDAAGHRAFGPVDLEE